MPTLEGNQRSTLVQISFRTDQLFNLKFTSKQIAKLAEKCEKKERDEKKKVKTVFNFLNSLL